MKIFLLLFFICSLSAFNPFDEQSYHQSIDDSSVDNFRNQLELFSAPDLHGFNYSSQPRRLARKRTKKHKKPKKLKEEIEDLKKELNDSKKKYRKLMKKEKKKKTKKTKKKLKDKKARNLHTALLRETLLNRFLSDSGDKSLDRSLLTLLTDKRAVHHLNIPKNQKDKAVLKNTVTNQLPAILTHALTYEDCDKLARRRLTVDKYTDLMDSLKDRSVQEKKERLLGVSDMVNSVFSSLANMLNGFTSTVKDIITGPDGPEAGVAALGVFGALKMKNSREFRKRQTYLVRETDFIGLLVTSYRNRVRRMSECAQKANTAKTKVIAIDHNMGGRFNRQFDNFGGPPY